MVFRPENQVGELWVGSNALPLVHRFKFLNYFSLMHSNTNNKTKYTGHIFKHSSFCVIF